MRHVGGSCTAFVAALERRFATPSARFRLALSTGFFVATVGMTTVSIGRSGNAQDFFSGISNLFGVTPQTAYQGNHGEADGRRGYRSADGYGHRASSHRHRVVVASSDAGGPVRLGRASICVRLCDGFAFPVGDFHGQGDIAPQESTCRSECPGARTALYVMPTGDSMIGNAVDAHTGEVYSQKAAGFHYTTYIDESCSCHPHGGNRVSSLLRDYTLRRGDAVMTAGGVKVFHGGNDHFPFRQADFVKLAQSRDVEKAARATFRDIERASVTTDHPAMAQGGKPTPASAGLEVLQRQAANFSPGH